MAKNEVELRQLPKITDPRGNLTFVESERHVPFEIKRVFYIYDVPTGESRGAHAHKRLQMFFICLSGGLEILIDDGREKKVVRLNRPWQGLYVPPLHWTSMQNWDSGSVCLVLVSEHYDAEEYIRDYGDFLKALQEKNSK